MIFSNFCYKFLIFLNICNKIFKMFSIFSILVILFYLNVVELIFMILTKFVKYFLYYIHWNIFTIGLTSSGFCFPPPYVNKFWLRPCNGKTCFSRFGLAITINSHIYWGAKFLRGGGRPPRHPPVGYGPVVLYELFVRPAARGKVWTGLKGHTLPQSMEDKRTLY